MFGGSRTGGYSTSELLGDTWEYKNGTWQPLTPASSPGVRYRAGLGSYQGTVVLFGGYGLTTTSASSAAYLNDTWIWDGTTWTPKQPAHKPPTRYSPAIGTLNDRLFMFGGYNGSALNDTWEWDGTDWIDRTTTTRPSARDGAAIANVGGERLVLFGAGGGDTWEWNGAEWMQRTPALSPSSRQYLKSASLDGGVILFGGATGQSTSSTYYDDTWRWNGATWTRLLAAGPPTARRDFAMGPLGNGVLLVGGYLSSGATSMETWAFTGSGWVARTSGPSTRMGFSLVAR
jgi:hypothetical protein